MKKISKHPRSESAPASSVQWWSIFVLVAVVTVVLVMVFWDKEGSVKGEVVAKVNGEAITLEQLNTQYARLPPELKAVLSRAGLLEQLVDEHLLLQEADQQGYKTSDKEVSEVITQSILLTGMDQEAFYKRLAEENITKEYLHDFYSKQIIINKLLNDSILAHVVISDADVQAFYEKNKDKYLVPEQRAASHILFLVEEEKDEQVAASKAKDIAKIATPGNFASLAANFSEDPGSAPRGGELGKFGRGALVPTFEDKVFSMKEGEISAPVRTPFGYHIIYLQKVFPAQQLALNDVKGNIESYLTAEKQRSMYKEYITALRSKAKIEILLESAAPVTAAPTFLSTGDELCTDDSGKPIVRFFGLTTCPHCQWVGSTFDKVAKEYMSAGKIRAVHYQLDTGDDTLTTDVEKLVAAPELAIFERYSPQKQVPLFVMGCKYMRIGNGYEAQNDLVKEEAEFRAILDDLVA